MVDIDENKKLIEQFYTSLKNGESEFFLSLMHDDIEMNLSGNTPLSGHFKGKDVLIDQVYPNLMDKLDFDNFTFCTRWKIMCLGGDMVTAIMEAQGQTLSGKRYDQRYCHIFKIESGKVKVLWEFFDTELVRNSLFDGQDLNSPFSEFKF